MVYYTHKIKTYFRYNGEYSKEEIIMKLIKVSLIAATLLFTTSVYGGAEEGKEMFNEAKCIECHNTSDFKNSKKVHSFKQLEARVQACQLNSDAGWFDEDVTDVADYLNHDFYKFKK